MWAIAHRDLWPCRVVSGSPCRPRARAIGAGGSSFSEWVSTRSIRPSLATPPRGQCWGSRTTASARSAASAEATARSAYLTSPQRFRPRPTLAGPTPSGSAPASATPMARPCGQRTSGTLSNACSAWGSPYLTGTSLSKIVGAARCKKGRSCDLSRGAIATVRHPPTFRLSAPDPTFLASLALAVPGPPASPQRRSKRRGFPQPAHMRSRATPQAGN